MHGDLFKDTYLYARHLRAGLRVWLASLNILTGLQFFWLPLGSVCQCGVWEWCYGGRSVAGGEVVEEGLERSVGVIFLAQD